MERARGSTSLAVCIVTSAVLGLTRGGGVATATSTLIDHLVATDHRVTVLYTEIANGAPACHEQTWSHWVRVMEDRGIELASIQHDGHWAEWSRKAWLVKEFLGQRDFDLVYFNDHHGSGYYALGAKRAGLVPFARQLHCVIEQMMG